MNSHVSSILLGACFTGLMLWAGPLSTDLTGPFGGV
jgi:hypothetical protein